LYVYSAGNIREKIRSLKSVLDKYFPDYRIQYPIKANSNLHLLKLIREEGLYADCSSPGEVFLARKAGFEMSLSTYTGNYESIADLKAAFDAGMIINLDDFHRLNDLLTVGKPKIISFRINPGIGRGGFEGITTGGTDAKFGIPYEKTREAYESALKAGFKHFGIHMMTGSNILEPFYFAEITQKLTMIAGEALEGLGIQLEFINIGGGLGIPYTEEELPLDLETTFKHVAEVFHENVARYNLGNPTLVIEPGRYIVGDAGILVAEIQHVKHSYRTYVGIDAGMNVLLRPALYGAYHRVSINGKPDNEKDGLNCFITGQVCENSDIHPVERILPDPQPGDLLIIHEAGAYGYAMSSNYNNRPRPAEVLVDGDTIKLIRYRESPEDLLKDIPGEE
ncbi:MAG: diaminopimelate decarboxylase, partial [Methanobacteriota archaeon]